MSEFEVYAVVIGRKGVNLRYISSDPNNDSYLAIYTDWTEARFARKKILADCGHKDVHIIKLESYR